MHAHTLAEIPPLDSSLSGMLKDGCWWIDVLSPTDDEMMEFGRVSVVLSILRKVNK